MFERQGPLVLSSDMSQDSKRDGRGEEIAKKGRLRDSEIGVEGE